MPRITATGNFFKNDHRGQTSNQGYQEKIFPATEKTLKTPFSLSIAAIPAESIPFIGVAVLIADTGYELYAACETVRELDQLYGKLGMAEEVPDDSVHSVCAPQLPKAGDVWGDVVENVDQWWGSLLGAV
jgi:hypothetical protein